MTVSEYDALNHLIRQEISKDAFPEDTIQKTYTYDKRGNLTGEYQDGDLLHGYAFNSMNRLEKAWDSEGTEAEYFYNALGQRTARRTAEETEEYLLDLTKPYHNLLELQKGKHRQTFYWDMNVSAMEDENRTLQYYLQDELGSPLRVLYRSGSGAAYGYDEFGADLYDPEKKPGAGRQYSRQGEHQPFGFTGYRYDDISGTYFAQAREYQPGVGRFTAEDILRSGSNWYIYCLNNPLIYIDLKGLESYIFYTTGDDSDFSDQAKWKEEQLKNTGENVVMIPVSSVEDFTDGWESMGKVNGEEVDINNVEIYTHGNPTTLIFQEGSYTEAINISGKNSKGDKIPKVDDLTEKPINELNIYACNAGNYLEYFHTGTNIAAEFSKKTQGGVTYAFDGNVAFGTPKWKFWEPSTGYEARLSTSQKSFKAIRAKYNSHVDPKGKLAFRNGIYLRYGFWNNTSFTYLGDVNCGE